MSVPLLPLADRPRFAAKMIAVWRWHHMAMGEELAVTIMPGEWPIDTPYELKGCKIVEHPSVGGSGGVLVLGRKGSDWYGAYQLATADQLGWSTEELALATFYMKVGDDPDMKLWLSPDPVTGEVPMWSIARDGGR